MPVKIELPDALWARLQELAEPLVDTPVSLVERLLNERAAASKPLQPAPNESEKDGAVPVYRGTKPPDLTHTKPITFAFDGVQMAKPTWDGLLNAAVYKAHAHAKQPGDLKRLLVIPHLKGKKEDEGYRYLADIDLSYQRQDANSAWRAAHHVAEQLQLPIMAEFVWRHKEKAAFPGLPGLLTGSVSPAAS